ncbi:MAG: hypothetical protein ABSC11_13610 [Smithella sp.]
MSKKIILSFIMAAILGLAFMISPIIYPAKAEEKTKAPVNKQAASNVNNITQAAVNAGVLSCISRINQVANFLTANTQGLGTMIFLPPNNPDNQLISLSMEIPLKDSSAYASASFAPNQANGCAGMYETVAYWPQKCAEVGEKQFGSFKKGGALSKNITVMNGGESIKIFLMPAGAGCVSIKKEIVR